ncbi:hypothetical protein P7K49_027748, partial [Saguinus oedipus]
MLGEAYVVESREEANGLVETLLQLGGRGPGWRLNGWVEILLLHGPQSQVEADAWVEILLQLGGHGPGWRPMARRKPHSC